ncbi:TRAP transporter, 4TM/12TM fusion protein [Halogranum gelatinilyticum]|uniref:TRAP transporter, 4TM/12TM fusion protein n=1 Tax=Halogranum gelatinilyticum TaxID=660521 RepID=A0A1G9NSI9_9EURY|nr:TRAP transporter permease [Halogranum gelatinilyticum]SDL89359.1 TRAP transporter, 4TM/12TM fusion protein [Halogranum gelatinilyticum]
MTTNTDTETEELTEEEKQKLLQELERKRSLRGPAAVVVAVVGILFSAYQMWIAARGFEFEVMLPGLGEVGFALQQLQINAIHVVFALVLTFLLFPASTGDGFVSRRLKAIPPAVRDRAGKDSPVTGAVEGLRAAVAWIAGDPERNRVTPLDVVFILFSLATGQYMLTQFDEIQRMRALGLDAGRTVGEIHWYLAPIADAISLVGIPLNEVSWAFVLGVAGVLLVLEATRRTLGLYLMLIVSSFIVYARYGYLIPLDAPFVGVLSIQPGQWSSIITDLWYNTNNGVFGIPVTVSVQFIYIFILFGAFLEMSGAGQWFIDLAYGATGSRKGGPAKASILSSGFMGTISGSSIANTVTTGAFTIPLMKRSGYRAEFAGAVEASASSGGQILPPVMGAAAFLIVEYTGTPYSDVITAAAIPAIVFFFGVWVMVHLEASRVGIGGIDPSELVNLGSHLKRGWFYLVPLGLLLYYLIVARLSVARSAWFTIVAIIALIALMAAYNERTRLPLFAAISGLFVAETAAFLVTGVDLVSAVTGTGGAGLAPLAAVEAAAGTLGTIILFVSFATLLFSPKSGSPLLDYDDQVDDTAESLIPNLADNKAAKFTTFIVKSMDSGARTATTVVIAVAAAGIIPGVISVTGLGPNLTALLLDISGGSLVLLLVITAISSIILGMGMPTTVTYIILVSMLAAPISQAAAIPILAAHLFILYFGVIADITPPVAVAAYAASGVAKSDPFETGVEAFSLSLNKAIVPFAFVLSPGILLIRGVGDGDDVNVLTLADVADLGFFIPEVLIPIVCVFVGVLALGPTIIGYFYTHVGRTERVLFAVSALLLMAPALVFTPVFTLLSLSGGGIADNTLVYDLGLRAVGAVLFGILTLKNRDSSKRGDQPSPVGGSAEATAE